MANNERIKFLKDAIKFKRDGQIERVNVSYSDSDLTNFPKGTITIYGKHYKSLPKELNPENRSDTQTDYFENDTVRIFPNSKHYNKVLKAMMGKRQSYEKREQKKALQVVSTDFALMEKIKKLAQVSEKNALLDYEMSGYMRDAQRREIFGNMAKHNIRHKKKYTYVDHASSGKYLVQTQGADKGHVFGIKAYGQKGYHQGEIDKVISQIEKNNEQLMKLIFKKSAKF